MALGAEDEEIGNVFVQIVAPWVDFLVRLATLNLASFVSGFLDERVPGLDQFALLLRKCGHYGVYPNITREFLSQLFGFLAHDVVSARGKL